MWFQDLLGAEGDLREAARKDGSHTVVALYNLALALYYKGKIRVSPHSWWANTCWY